MLSDVESLSALDREDAAVIAALLGSAIAPVEGKRAARTLPGVNVELAHSVADLQRMLETNEREFLLSLVKATPEWKLLDIAHLKQLPALRWKLTNLDKLAKSSPKKFTEQANALEHLLGTI